MLARFLGNKGRRSQQIHLVAFEPDRFPDVRSFQDNMVETKRIFNTQKTVSGLDRPSQSPKGAITDNLHTTTFWKYTTLHVEYPFRPG